MEKTYTKTEQDRLLRSLIEILVLTGYDITHLLFKPRSYFDYQKIEKMNEQLRKKHGYDV